MREAAHVMPPIRLISVISLVSRLVLTADRC